MLLQFRFKNYKSFADEAVLDMTAMPIREHTNSLIEVNGNHILPVAAIFGANASGKSTIFNAFVAMRRELLKLSEKNIEHNYIIPYIFDEELKQEATEFEVSINIEDKEYRYGFLRNKVEVFEEWLYERKFAKTTRAKEKCVFFRTKGELEEITSIKGEEEEIKFVHSMCSNDELLLSSLGKRDKSKYACVYKWFKSKPLCSDFSDFKDESVHLEATKHFLYGNTRLIEDVVGLLQTFDNSIVDVEINKEEDANMNETYRVYSYHLNSQEERVRVPFESESAGTKKIFSFAMFLLLATNGEGAILFIDEFDTKLHPLALRYLVRWFTDQKKNEGKGQLVFSSHNLVCLDTSDLRRDEIWFVEKENQKSNLYSLYDFKDEDTTVRADMNFGKNYLSGRFGAIPFQEESKE